MKTFAAIWLLAFFAGLGSLRAEQVEMKNGDRYAGKVLSMTPDTVVLQSEILGRLNLPRRKVASIALGEAAPVHPAPCPTNAPSIILTNSNGDIAGALHNLGANTNFIEQVRKQFLSDAGPEANGKFDDLVGELFSGKVNLNDLRAQAKAAADQIRSLEQQSGDASGMLDSYLAILDNFLKEGATQPSPPASVPSASTNALPRIIITR